MAARRGDETADETTMNPLPDRLPLVIGVTGHRDLRDQDVTVLEREVAAAKPWLFANRPLQADITSAVAWRFTQMELPGLIPAKDHPALAALSARAESMPAFLAFPPD